MGQVKNRKRFNFRLFVLFRGSRRPGWARLPLLAGAPGHLRDLPLAKTLISGSFGLIGLARAAIGIAARSVMCGMDASLPLLWASVPLIFRRRTRYSARSAWTHFIMPADHFWLPGFSIAVCAMMPTDRRATSLEVSLFPFSIFRLRRTVRGYHFPDDPALAFCDLGTHARDRFALAVFNASRLRIRALIV
jgi:hypothetical protein